MKLVALGGLGLESSTFTRPKPLLLLAYLALEGAQQRKHLAELFWLGSNRMKNLSMAFTLLRQGAGEVLEVDAREAKIKIGSDVKELMVALNKRDWAAAANLYTGAFLEGVVLDDWSSELEEWVYKTREYFAERVQYALLNLAEDAAKRQDFETATTFAERAYKLPGLAGTELASLQRLYPLLSAGKSILAPEVRKEAESYSVVLQLKSEEAKLLFKSEVKPTVTLPMRATSFIGRDVELTELATLLLNKRHVSLVTLLGTAGVGKTRLALQFAHEQQKLNAFKDGVYFAPLEPLEDSSLIPTILLHYFGLQQQGKTEPLQQLIDFIDTKNILLVLDNAEHVTSGLIVLSLLLSNCPNLKMLVTSRETLKLEEEFVYALGGLSVPDTFSNDAKLSDAVQLFKERARQVKPQFELSEHLSHVIQICELVEGLPLGIELAASWVRLMSCAEIAAEIERGLELLSSTAKNISERHRSLRVAFDYSWNLLTSKEQSVLRRLSVFRGGFRREAAAEVAGATIPMLGSLVDKSLVRVLHGGRYDFHPLLLQFAKEKLASDAEEKSATEERHARYFVTFFSAKRDSIPRIGQNDVTDLLADELANFEHMWYYLAQHKWLEEIAGLATATFLLDFNLGRLQEGAKLLAKVRASLDSNNPEHFFALGSLCVREAGYLKYLASFRESVLIAEEGLTYLQRSSHPEVWVKMTTGLNEAGVSSYHLGQFEKAKNYYERAIELAVTHNHAINARRFTSNLAILLWHLGDNEKAAAMKRELVASHKERKDWTSAASDLGGLALIALTLKHFAEAKALLDEALMLLEQHGLRAPAIACDLTSSLGMTHGCLGNKEQALHFHEAALALAKDIGSPLHESSVLSEYAYTLTTLGDFDKAEAYLQKTIAILWKGDDRGRLLLNLLYWIRNKIAKSETSEAALLYCVLSQTELAPKDKALAKDLLATLPGKLPNKELNHLKQAGEKLSLEEVVERIIAGTSRVKPFATPVR